MIPLSNLEGEYRAVLGRNSKAMTIEDLPTSDEIGSVILHLAGVGSLEKPSLSPLATQFKVMLGRWDEKSNTWMWTTVGCLGDYPGKFLVSVELQTMWSSPGAKPLKELLKHRPLRINLMLDSHVEKKGRRAVSRLHPGGTISTATLEVTEP